MHLIYIHLSNTWAVILLRRVAPSLAGVSVPLLGVCVPDVGGTTGCFGFGLVKMGVAN